MCVVASFPGSSAPEREIELVHTRVQFAFLESLGTRLCVWYHKQSILGLVLDSGLRLLGPSANYDVGPNCHFQKFNAVFTCMFHHDVTSNGLPRPEELGRT